jgi:hypothetical protein
LCFPLKDRKAQPNPNQNQYKGIMLVAFFCSELQGKHYLPFSVSKSKELLFSQLFMCIPTRIVIIVLGTLGMELHQHRDV